MAKKIIIKEEPLIKKHHIDIKIIIFSIIAIILCAIFYILALKPADKKPVQLNNNQNTNQAQNNDINDTTANLLADQSKIKKIKDYDELKDFLLSKEAYHGGDNMIMEKSMMLGAPNGMGGEMLDTAVATKESSGDYSETNIQVQGVDEADIIKTDGKYIYAISGNELFIIDAFPADQSKIVSKIKFKSKPQNIYINGNSLAVYGRDDLIYKTDLYKTLRPSNFTFLKVFDLSDKKNPKQIRDLDFEGTFYNSRMVGDYVYFITQQPARYYKNMPEPIILSDGQAIVREKMMDIYYINMPYSSYNFTHIAAINIKNNREDINSEAYLLSYGQNLYVSQKNIYITYTKYVSEEMLMADSVKEVVFPMLDSDSRQIIKEIEATSERVLSYEEKAGKILNIVGMYISMLSQEEQNAIEKKVKQKLAEKYEDISKELEKTVIHKIAINKNKLEYKAVGEVTGQILNQFSMDENNGYFRIATTKNRTWPRLMEDGGRMESYNNLYVLDKDLKIVGKIENLAEGERIYSARFMQNRAYLVTFKQVDPLFVIDLKNPKNPHVLGKLKIPGFSNYLHPYDETTLIGLGKDSGDWNAKLKLSLFDVSNIGNPKEIDNYIMGDDGGSSIALIDHKAFLFSKDKNLLVIPVQFKKQLLRKGMNEIKIINDFNGAAVFYVNKDGFDLKAKISHLCEENFEKEITEYKYYNSNIKRSLYISDTLYTFSDNYLMANDLDDFETIKILDLHYSDNDFEIIN